MSVQGACTADVSVLFLALAVDDSGQLDKFELKALCVKLGLAMNARQLKEVPSCPTSPNRHSSCVCMTSMMLLPEPHSLRRVAGVEVDGPRRRRGDRLRRIREMVLGRGKLARP
jgi:hypothetical protein